MKLLWFTVTSVLVVIILILVFVFSGKYNVSAMQPHYNVTTWLINTTMKKSVNEHAKNIVVPDLSNPAMIKMGFINYRILCSDCHGAPGVLPSELAKGLNPKAPNLTKAVKEWTAAELFWITKHGIRMTGMPAWGVTNSDQKLWAIVAFLEKLPAISPAEYKKLITANQNVTFKSN